MKMRILFFSLLVFLIGIASAKVDLVTLPERDAMQLTIYNSADLTLARDLRMLTLKEGRNSLQFSWANTLIDPTSLEMAALRNGDKIEVMDLVFPPRVKNLGLWQIDSEMSGPAPIEITYLTSGLSWRAFYVGTLSGNEKTMHLQGYVRVMNRSGEDYENAQVRLVVGKVHLLDQIAALAQREHPYDRPGKVIEHLSKLEKGRQAVERFDRMDMFFENGLRSGFGGGIGGGGFGGQGLGRPKEIVKEGLSEYFVYTIEGMETIPNGWSKRLPSFEAEDIPVVNLYKYEEELYRHQVVRFLSFKNNEEHKLGETPIPGGGMKVYRGVDADGHLSYEGQSSFKYIPVDEDVELNLGAVANVVVEPVLMATRTLNYRFDNDGDIIGWDTQKTFRVQMKNTRDVAVKIEIKRAFGQAFWDLVKRGDFGEYEKVDVQKVKFTLELPPRSNREFEYDLTTYHGVRVDEVGQ